MKRVGASNGKIGKGTPLEAAETLVMGTTGKGTTSVVPLGATKYAALAAEGDAGSRFKGSRFIR